MIVLNQSETGCELPIKLWPPGHDQLSAAVGWAEQFDHAVYQQFRNLANHPLARKWVCGMPDYHLGYGMPIGGVLATQGGVVPNAVGVDIGCGMIAVRSILEADSLTRDTLGKLRAAIHKRVPVGNKHHETTQKLPQGAERAARLGLGSHGPVPIARGQLERATYQLGTLGGGNHFIELQKDEDGRLWIMLHSGSRNVGFKVCNHYASVAKDYMKSFKVKVDPDLAFLPVTVPEYEMYLAEMRWCMDFAEANRKTMLEAVYEAFRDVMKGELIIDLTVDTHHNFAALENHGGENLMIHRKGAVKASGLVTIPGSMGTGSYIGKGLESPESFNTCSHGAGRRMSRTEAKKTITHEQAVASMEGVVYGVREGEYDEMPAAYKNIDEVMAAQSDLITPLYRLTPLTVVKG